MSAASELPRVLEEPRLRVAEVAVAKWLMAPDLDALLRETPSLSVAAARKVGVTLEGSLLFGLLADTPLVHDTVRALADRARAMPAATLQRRWHLDRLPFDFQRLKQRQHEAEYVKAAKP